MRAMVFQSTTKFLPGLRWVLGSLLFIADNFGDLNLQDSESREVSLINEAQLGHGLVMLGKTDPDPLGDKADHTSVVPGAITDPIHQSSPESDSEGDWEVYMVEQGEEPLEKTVEEIQWEAEEEISWAARLARDAKKGKRHNDL
jgi:hypothetical protein